MLTLSQGALATPLLCRSVDKAQKRLLLRPNMARSLIAIVCSPICTDDMIGDLKGLCVEVTGTKPRKFCIRSLNGLSVSF